VICDSFALIERGIGIVFFERHITLLVCAFVQGFVSAIGNWRVVKKDF
jgi:hypothetical protein